jgi:hypothetical protein
LSQDLLERLARAHDIQLSYKDLQENEIHARPEALLAALKGMGVIEDDADVADALVAYENTSWLWRLPLEEMSIPENAKKPVIEYTWVFEVNGEEKEFVTNGSYPEVDGKYLSVETKMIEEGYEPKILDFSIESEDEDLTTYFLEKEHLIMIVSYGLETAEKKGLDKLKAISDEALRNGYTVIGLTASGNDTKQYIKETYHLDFDFYLCDEKVLKTIVRSNPGVVKLNKGTVIQKVHWNDIDDLELPFVEKEIVVKKEISGIGYFIDGQPSSKEEVETLDTLKVESVNVIKDSIQIQELNSQNGTFYTGIIEVTLKKD